MLYSFERSDNLVFFVNYATLFVKIINVYILCLQLIAITSK